MTRGRGGSRAEVSVKHCRGPQHILMLVKVNILSFKQVLMGGLFFSVSSVSFQAFLSVAWPTGVQLLVFFCSSVPVVLFGTPGISRCRSQHISVESSSLLHHSIYL